MILAAAAFMATACTQYNFDEILQNQEDISLSIKGDIIISYDPVTYQSGHNVTYHQYRVHDDNMECYYILTCNEKPWYEGQTITADLTYTENAFIKDEKGLEFAVKKTDDNGLVWMWNSSKNIGVVIQNLQ